MTENSKATAVGVTTAVGTATVTALIAAAGPPVVGAAMAGMATAAGPPAPSGSSVTRRGSSTGRIGAMSDGPSYDHCRVVRRMRCRCVGQGFRPPAPQRRDHEG